MTFLEYSEEVRVELAPFLEEFFKKQTVFTKVSPWGADLQKRLPTFITSGKLLRGSLVILSYEMFSGNTRKDAIKVAAALELFHSSLLIHDDIMDQDPMRRGNKTFYAQYQELAEKENLTNAARTGESLAICAGDMGFFLGYSLLSTLSLDPKITMSLLHTISEELSLVGLGQMQDVALGARSDMPTEEEILSVYRYKTARYTFSLPLILGAILANQNDKTLEILTKLGESVGTIYQIKDDELNIFGDETTIAKSVGSDISEDKKTLIKYYLFQRSDEKQRETLNKIFGKPLDKESLKVVKKMIEVLGVKELLTEKNKMHQTKYEEFLKGLTVSEEHKSQLNQLLSFVLNRSS